MVFAESLLLASTIFTFDTLSNYTNFDDKINLLKSDRASHWLLTENPDSISNNDQKTSLFQQLNLSLRQQKQIEQIRHRYHYQIMQIREKLSTAQQQLVHMMAGTDSAVAIRNKHQEILQFRQQLGQLQFESILATREVLTLQQRQRFAEIMESR